MCRKRGRNDGTLSLAQGAAPRQRHRLDGGAALSAAALRLPCRGGARLGQVRDLQGDGAPTAARHPEPVDDGELGLWSGAGPLESLLPRALAEAHGHTGCVACGAYSKDMWQVGSVVVRD